tara:strand:- start:385 stop:612 length:228 start_codon:yes stop_codon:yes gene_type:complete
MKISKVIYRPYLLLTILKRKGLKMTIDNLRNSGYEGNSLYYEFEDVFPEECCGNPLDCPEYISGACKKDKESEDG